MAAEARWISPDPEVTEAVGAALGAALEAGAVVALDGELGAGKTCLVRGLARGLGIEEPVTSPSFTLMQFYEGRLPLYHFDAWMAGRGLAFLEAGGAEALDGEGVAVVEWAGRVADYLPATRLEVLLEHRGPSERLLRVAVRGPAGARPDLEAALQAAAGVPGLADPGSAAAGPPGSGENRGPG
ncbi:MAG: tRNA (adenosine(37)-N6)-threonylcarbamoyltransferase complex ATPase subunit type 1 TsaE [Planctomycetota bacterium]